MQSFVTVVIPFDCSKREAVDGAIAQFAPKQATRSTAAPSVAGQIVVDALDKAEVIHFLSIIALAPGSPADLERKWPRSAARPIERSPSIDGQIECRHSTSLQPEVPAPVDLENDRYHLLIEVSSDVGLDETLVRVVGAIGDQLISILRAAGIDWMTPTARIDPAEPLNSEQRRLHAFLRHHHVTISDSWRGTFGQMHGGTPGMTARRIRREHALADNVAAAIDSASKGESGPLDQPQSATATAWAERFPVEKLQSVRDWLWRSQSSKDEALWIFTAEPADLLKGVPVGPWLKLRATVSVVQKLLWPLNLVVALVLVVMALDAQIGHVGISPTIVLERLTQFASRATSFDGPRPSLSVIGVLVGFGLLLWWRPPGRHPFTTIVLPSLLLLIIATGALLSSAGWFALITIGTLSVAALIGGTGYLMLQRAEQRDRVDDITPPLGQVEALMDRENFVRQNHMFTVSRIKPGILRAVALRVILAVVGANPFVSRPGFLGTNGVIHFARWIVLRDGRKPWWRDPGRLVFWSNYDGTWESYVADFIADAPSNVTGLWSNCVGFPRARNLTDEGAKNRDRLVRWARRQQQPTYFWYSAYPTLTTDRIRINAAIRQGLASAATDADARDWLSLFGSQPRPAAALRTSQIPILAFGALSRLRYATCYLVRFRPRAHVPHRRAWLEKASEYVSFGGYLPGQHIAVALALSATGLRRIGVPKTALATFPPPFQEGMWTERRARALGDDDPTSSPDQWIWGSHDRLVDVFMTIYADTPDGADRLWKWLEKGSASAIELLEEIPLTPTIRYEHEKAASTTSGPRPAGCPMGEPNEAGWDGTSPAARKRGPRSIFNTEPFGFADGISQPVIRGMPWGTNKVAHNDFVAPGEIILGYPDNLGRIPPSPGIPPAKDIEHTLADEIPDPDPARQRPDASLYLGDGWRDLGANGTFLVVRHLEQKRDVWNGWLDHQVDHIEKNLIVAADDEGTALLWTDQQTKAAWDASHPAREDAAVGSTAGMTSQKRRELIKEAIKAKMIGRWPDGTPLTRFPTMPRGMDAALDNSFRFGVEDPEGLGCPLGAHIRRANPRDTLVPGSQEEIDAVNRHRILRVGRAFGGSNDRFTEAQSERYGRDGLMFMCLNADIDRQFEFVQKSWLLNPSIHGLDNQEDPLLGRKGRSMSIPTQSGVIPLENLPRLVAVRGGGYFFMPGRATLNFLCGGRTAGRKSSPPDGGPREGESHSPPAAAPSVHTSEAAILVDRSAVTRAVEAPVPQVASSDFSPH